MQVIPCIPRPRSGIETAHDKYKTCRQAVIAAFAGSIGVALLTQISARSLLIHKPADEVRHKPADQVSHKPADQVTTLNQRDALGEFAAVPPTWV